MCVVNAAEEVGGGAEWISRGRRGSAVSGNIGDEGVVRFEYGLGGNCGRGDDTVDCAASLRGEECTEGDCEDRCCLSGYTSSTEGDWAACVDCDAASFELLSGPTIIVGVGGGCESGTTLRGVSKES